MSDAKRKPKRKPAKLAAAYQAPKSTAERMDQKVEDPVVVKAIEVTTETAVSARGAALDAKQAATNNIESVRGQASNSFAEGRRTAQEWEQGIERSIAARPFRAILIAAVIGFFIGRWLSRDGDQ